LAGWSLGLYSWGPPLCFRVLCRYGRVAPTVGELCDSFGQPRDRVTPGHPLLAVFGALQLAVILGAACRHRLPNLLARAASTPAGYA
jgi:hypothetical protein